jgi:uroporphyrinogen decarboxylase
MSKRELVQKVLNNGEAERVPTGFWFHYTKDELADGLKDPSIIKINTEGHKKFFTEFQPDIVKIMTDGYFLYPNEVFLHAQKAADFAKLTPLAKNHPWFEQQIAHAKTLTDFFGGEVFSFYNIFSPATIFKFARGKEGKKILADFILEDKQAVIHALSVAAEDIAWLSAKLIREGKADGIYYSTQDVGDSRITEELWKAVLAPADIKVLEGANTAGNYNILHICGYEGHRNKLEHYVDYPAQVIN